MSNWTEWLKAFELKPRYLFAITSMGLLLLFLPDKYVAPFGLEQFRVTQRQWIGLATLGATVLLIIQSCIHIYGWQANRKKKKQAEVADQEANEKRRLVQEKRNEQIRRHLGTLSQPEAWLLALCLEKNQQTVTVSFENPGAASLRAKQLMFASSGSYDAIPHTIPDEIWQHLQELKGQFIPEDHVDYQRFRERLYEFEVSLNPWKHLI